MGGWGTLHVFPEIKEGKMPPHDTPPKQAAKNISVETEQLFRLERLELCVWLLCSTKGSAMPRPMAEAPEQGGSL